VWDRVSGGQAWIGDCFRTLEMAPSRVGLGAVLFVPNSRFMVGWRLEMLGSEADVRFQRCGQCLESRSVGQEDTRLLGQTGRHNSFSECSVYVQPCV
jgi:hypothetical protein